MAKAAATFEFYTGTNPKPIAPRWQACRGAAQDAIESVALPTTYTWIIRFSDGTTKMATRAYHTATGARAVMESTLLRVRPEKLALLEATAVVRR